MKESICVLLKEKPLLYFIRYFTCKRIKTKVLTVPSVSGCISATDLTALSIAMYQRGAVTALSAHSTHGGGTPTVRFCFSHLFIVLVRIQSGAAECRCAGAARIHRQKRHSLLFSGSRERSPSPLMPSPSRAISEETALSCTLIGKKKTSLCPQQDLSSSPLWPCSLLFSFLPLPLPLPPSLSLSLSHTHTYSRSVV